MSDVDQELAAMRSIRRFMQKRDRPPMAHEIGAAAGKNWPPNPQRKAALERLVRKGMVKHSESGRCWLTIEGQKAIQAD